MKKPLLQDILNFVLSISLFSTILLVYNQAKHINELNSNIEELQEVNVLTIQVLCKKEIIDCGATPWL